MDDGQIRVGLAVDMASLNSGMAEASSSVTASSSSMKDALKALKTAQDQYTEAAKFGASAQAIYADALKQAEAAVKSLKDAETEAANAKRQAMIQQKRDYEDYIAQQKAADAAQKASQASIRTLSTEMSLAEGKTQGATRALAALIQKFPSLSGAAQAAFTAFGLFAAIEIAVEFGEKLYDAFDLGGKRAEHTREQIEDMDNALNHSITTLDVQIDKLQQEQAKLEHVPFNGMKLALDEAAEAAQNLSDKLDETIKKELEALRDKEGALQPSATQTVIMGTQGNHQEQVMLDQHVKWINKAKTTQDVLNESTSFGVALQQRMNDLLIRQAEIQGMRAGGGVGVDIIGVKDYSKEIAGLQMMIDAQKKEHEQAQKTVELQGQQAATQKDREAATAGSELVKKDQQQLSDLEQQGHVIRVADEIKFWQQKKAEAEAGGNQYLGAVEAINNKLGELSHKSFSAHGKDPGVEKMKDDEQEYATFQQQGHLLSIQDEIKFWEQKKSEAEAGGARYLKAVEAINTRLGELSQRSLQEQSRTDNTSRSDEQQAARMEKIAELQAQLADPPKRAATDDMKDQVDELDRYHQKQLENFNLEAERMRLAQEGRAFTLPTQKTRDAQDTANLHAKEAQADQTYYAQKEKLVQDGYAKQIQQAKDAAEAEHQARSQGATNQITTIASESPSTPDGQKNANAQIAQVNQQYQIQELQGEANLRQQITQLKQQEADKLNQINQQEAASAAKARQQELSDSDQKNLQMVASYRSAMSSMNSAIIGGMDQWMTTHKSFTDSMIDASKKMAVSFINSLVQMGLKWVENEIMMKVFHISTEATKTATTTTSQTAQTAAVTAAQVAQTAAVTTAVTTQAAAKGAAMAAGMAEQSAALATTISINVATAESNAAVAASTVFAATAGDLEAAMAVFAEGQALVALAAFETGGIIPNTGIAMVHKGEAVLPQPLTQMLTDTAANGGNQGSNGGGHQFHSTYAPQITVLDSKGIEGFTRRAGDHLSAQMMRQARKANQIM